MAEPSNGNNPEQPKRELSTEQRLLLAFVLMMVVLFATPYLFRSSAPPPTPKKSTAVQPSAPAGAPAAAKPAAASSVESSGPAPAPLAAQKEDITVIDTELYKITLTNRGGVVRSWLLKKFKSNKGDPLELVNTAAKVDPPLSLYFKDRKPSTDLNAALFAVKPDPDGLGVTYEFSDGHTLARKTLRFQKNSYLSQIATEVTENGQGMAHFVTWRGGFGDLAVVNAAGAQTSVHYDTSAGKLIEQPAKAAKNGPVSSAGAFSFAGMADRYFAAVFLPPGSAMEEITFSDQARTVAEPKEEAFAGAGVSEGATNRFSLFVGPKDVDLLRTVNPKLETLVDFGWFAFLAKPLFLIVNWTTDRVVHNYGWAIVLVTVVITMALLPLKMTNLKSMKKMQALQPQIQAINEKYKGISIRDPRKAEQNQEVMELYKKHGVNPMGGCVPILIQLPFFYAFYKVFTVSVEMRGASWLWVTDLSQPEHLAIRILPIAMILSQFWMQKMTPQTTADPNQQRMMLFMPLVFGFLFYSFPSGLVLYYLTSNLVSMAQQWFFNRTMTPAELPVPVAPKQKSGKKR